MKIRSCFLSHWNIFILRPSLKTSLQPQKRTSSTSKQYLSSLFFFFCRLFLPTWFRTQSTKIIVDTDPKPAPLASVLADFFSHFSVAYSAPISWHGIGEAHIEQESEPKEIISTTLTTVEKGLCVFFFIVYWFAYEVKICYQLTGAPENIWHVTLGLLAV